MFRSIVAAAGILVCALPVPVRAANPRRAGITALHHAGSLTFGHALQMIWVMAGNGSKPYEAGFALDRTGDGYVIVLAPMTFEPDMKLAIPFNAVGKTVLLAHTHPDEGTDRPTRGDTKRRTGDVYSPVPNYVVSRTGLWVTDPKTATFSRVARNHWESFTPPALEQSVVFVQMAPPVRKHTK